MTFRIATVYAKAAWLVKMMTRHSSLEYGAS